MKRQIMLAVAMAAMIALAGCSAFGGNQPEGDQLAEDTGENLKGVQVGESHAYEIKITEKNQYGLVQGQPPFVMDHSLERQNLIKRYQYLNDQNNVHHVYLMGENGKVIAYYVAQGKVSSVNSRLTNGEQIVGSNNCVKEAHDQSEGSCFEAVESPQMDGSYGTNGNGIFFFTTDGHYVEYNGVYVVSEEPKNIQTEPVLVDQVDDNDDNDDGNETNSSSTGAPEQ